MKGFSQSSLLLSSLTAGIGVLAQSPTSSPEPWPLQSFKTTPYRPPFLNVTKAGQTEPGYLVFAPNDDARNTTAPTIFSDDGQLVFHAPEEGTFSFRPQTLNGEPVLTAWKGFKAKGFGFGSYVIMDSSYEEIGRVTLPQSDEDNFRTSFDTDFDSYIDLHEDTITEDGTMLVTVVNVTQADLRDAGGPKNGWIQDSLIYEIDIETNEVLFRWSTADHVSDIPLSDVEYELVDEGHNASHPWGYAHLNSVEKYGDSYLVSSRYTCSLFFIGKDGSLIWKLHGQNGGDFDLGPGTKFCYQHTALIEYQTSDKITLHIHNNDNADFTSETTQTTGLLLDLDLQSKKATLNRQIWDPVDPVYAISQGNYQSLANGHVLMGHGSVPKIAEFDEEGACVMRARFGFDDSADGYRVYRSPWVGTPKTKPLVVACPEKGVAAVYVSWNGATDVESWKISTGSGGKDLTVAKTVTRNGFETRAQLEDLPDQVVVEAVGGPNGGVESDPITVGDGC